MLLCDLPQDILIQVFVHFGLVDISAIARTNHYFHKISNLPYLWKRLCERILDADEIHELRKKKVNPHFDWKELLHSSSNCILHTKITIFSDKWAFCNSVCAVRTDYNFQSYWRVDNFSGITNCCIKAIQPFTEYRRVFEVTIISAGFWISIGFSSDNFMVCNTLSPLLHEQTNHGYVVGEAKTSLNVGFYIDTNHSELTCWRKLIQTPTIPVNEGRKYY